MKTPTFAIVGAVNHGKSSVAATLVEDDQIWIGRDPGMTRECQAFKSRVGSFELWDTPGFQDPREMLAEIEKDIRGASEPLAIFRNFSTRHAKDGTFAAERELLRPLLDGAAILYVVDTSRPFERVHGAEMELLRLTGHPRLAVLNPTAPAMHDATWRAKLGQHFGAVHQFDAHSASARDRAELLRAMAAVADRWKEPLREAAVAIEADWKNRLREAAQVMIELLDESLTHTVGKFLLPGQFAEKAAVIEELKRRFRDDLVRTEKDAHDRLIELFRHKRVDMQAGAAAPFGESLFNDETWSVFGLPWWALAGGGAFGGGAIGAKGGAIIGAHGEIALPSGIPTTVGASIGGVAGALTGGIAAVMLGKKVAQPQVSLSADGAKKRGWFGNIAGNAAAWMSRTGTEITVGPLRGENFPYILLDRATGLFCYLAKRTHARRDPADIEAAKLKDALDRAGASTESWNAELRDACKKFISGLRKPVEGADAGPRFRDLLAAHLESVSAKPFSYRTGHARGSTDAQAPAE
jgi:hypothetical protein